MIWTVVLDVIQGGLQRSGRIFKDLPQQDWVAQVMATFVNKSVDCVLTKSLVTTS